MKEAVSLAIIISFINLIFVPYPNTSSYTIYFVLSLLAISPFLILWNLWASARARRELEGHNGMDPGLVSLSDSYRIQSPQGLGLGADLEKGLVAAVEEIINVEGP